jgi:hypothetical protein
MKYHTGLTIEKLAFLAMFVLYIDVDLIEFSSGYHGRFIFLSLFDSYYLCLYVYST